MPDFASQSFKAFDADGSGDLSDSEWADYLRATQPGITDQQIRQAMKVKPTAEQVASNSDASKSIDRKNDVGGLDALVNPGIDKQNDALDAGDSAISAWNVLGTKQPTAEELRQDPSPLHSYQGGPQLDLQHSRDALWDPNTAGPSAYGDLNYVDPTIDKTGHAAATDALGQYRSLIQNGGHDAVSDANMQRRLAQANQAARSAREAGVQNAQERGMYGGGSGLMVDLQADSDLSRDAHSAGLESEALAQARRDAAIAGEGTLGTNLYGVDARTGQVAADARNKWGTDTAAGKDKYSTYQEDLRQKHGEDVADLWGQQDSNNWTQNGADRHSDIAGYNDTVIANYGIPQQVFNNAMTVTSGKAGQYNTNAGIDLGVGDRTKNTGLEIAKGVGTGVANAATAYQTFNGGVKKNPYA